MRYAVATAGVLLALHLAVSYWLLRRGARRDVSVAWQVDHDRREWQAGVEGVTWTWPIRK